VAWAGLGATVAIIWREISDHRDAKRARQAACYHEWTHQRPDWMDYDTQRRCSKCRKVELLKEDGTPL
jgi:hypothetical protein